MGLKDKLQKYQNQAANVITDTESSVQISRGKAKIPNICFHLQNYLALPMTLTGGALG